MQVQSQAAAASFHEVPRAEQFRAIYRAEFEFVWAAARRFGVPAAALDDAVQEVFLTAYRRLDGLRYEVSPRAWLYAVTRKIAARHHRGSMRLARRMAAIAVVSADANEAPHARHDAAQELAKLLALLPRGTREVWEMTELLGMSGPEIAGELQLPLNTVYSRLRLARAQLVNAANVAVCVAETRRGEAPAAEAADRNWAVMLPVMGKLGGWSAISAMVSSHAGMAVTLVAVSGAVVMAVVPVGSRTSAQSDAVESIEERSRVQVERAVGRAAVVNDVASEPTVEREEPVARRAVAAPDRLAAEVALIDRARAQLVARDAVAALTVLAMHAREFPDGALRDAREAARVEAMCLQGEREAAEAGARRLFEQMPESLVARRFEHYVCAP